MRELIYLWHFALLRIYLQVSPSPLWQLINDPNSTLNMPYNNLDQVNSCNRSRSGKVTK
jgi:hypothetical protein